jgi:hypothetical protein
MLVGVYDNVNRLGFEKRKRSFDLKQRKIPTSDVRNQIRASSYLSSSDLSLASKVIAELGPVTSLACRRENTGRAYTDRSIM